ncbi:unnamed protein product [Miscanthus lutarioriparius]|uniref:Uncharacterized protein n=1 Tax=Miscanthus lutarioriparius TaxID=422564 RepID=A0A811RKN1_9POAL|nr:unnamed protein product [Miscanthus lutarioriparius]
MGNEESRSTGAAWAASAVRERPRVGGRPPRGAQKGGYSGGRGGRWSVRRPQRTGGDEGRRRARRRGARSRRPSLEALMRTATATAGWRPSWAAVLRRPEADGKFSAAAVRGGWPRARRRGGAGGGGGEGDRPAVADGVRPVRHEVLLVGDAGLQFCGAAMVVGPEGARYARGTMVVIRDVPGHPFWCRRRRGDGEREAAASDAWQQVVRRQEARRRWEERTAERSAAGRARGGEEECGGREEHGKRPRGVGREVQAVEGAARGQRWRAAIKTEVEVRRHGEWWRDGGVASAGLP